MKAYVFSKFRVIFLSLLISLSLFSCKKGANPEEEQFNAFFDGYVDSISGDDKGGGGLSIGPDGAVVFPKSTKMKLGSVKMGWTLKKEDQGRFTLKGSGKNIRLEVKDLDLLESKGEVTVTLNLKMTVGGISKSKDVRLTLKAGSASPAQKKALKKLKEKLAKVEEELDDIQNEDETTKALRGDIQKLKEREEKAKKELAAAEKSGASKEKIKDLKKKLDEVHKGEAKRKKELEKAKKLVKEKRKLEDKLALGAKKEEILEKALKEAKKKGENTAKIQKDFDKEKKARKALEKKKKIAEKKAEEESRKLLEQATIA